MKEEILTNFDDCAFGRGEIAEKIILDNIDSRMILLFRNTVKDTIDTIELHDKLL